ncbi:MAG: transcriptional repressor [Planctomycetes bacterium]|nr:transcriptional repressor [Planctomycetota bacterium]
MQRTPRSAVNNDAIAADAECVLDRHVRERKLKASKVRMKLVRSIACMHGHFTAETLQGRLDASVRVSKATLYRTLGMMCECSLLISHEFGQGALFYESSLGHAHHDHLFCIGCRGITEFTSPSIEALQERVASESDFELTSHSLKLYGYCGACRRQRARETGAKL